MIEQTEHRIALPRLPEALDGLRIIQLTDLHRSRFTSDRLIRQAIALANEANPDLILLTGDYVTHNRKDIAPIADMLAGLRARLGIFAVLGNHDYSTDGPSVERALTLSGITVLSNKSVCVPGGLRIVGLDDDRFKRTDVARAFSQVEPDAPILVMAHNPAVAEWVTDYECVVFSGHTHGGQIRVPILTARKIRGIGAKHYQAGWYTVGKAKLYVNRGIGQVGLPMRFRCRSEIALFTLAST